jgi:peptidoglycan hydrolase CwlO-like protein
MMIDKDEVIRNLEKELKVAQEKLKHLEGIIENLEKELKALQKRFKNAEEWNAIQFAR